MKKIKGCLTKPFILIFIFVAILIVGYFIFKQTNIFERFSIGNKESSLEKRIGDIDYDNTYSPRFLWSEKNIEEQSFSLFGKIAKSYYDEISIEDEYVKITLDLSNATGDTLSSEDYALVTGNYEDITFVVTNATKIDQSEFESLEKDVLPQMEITILESPKNISHGCEHIDFKLRIKNIGKISIPHEKFLIIGGNWKFGFQTDDNLPEYGYGFNEETGEIAELGAEDFGVLEPGEQKDITYYGGGYVRTSEIGTGGQGNLFCGNFENEGGEHSIKFMMGVLEPYSYTDLIVGGESEIATISIDTCECDLSSE